MGLMWLVCEWLAPSSLLCQDHCWWQSTQSANCVSPNTEPWLFNQDSGSWLVVLCGGHRCGCTVGPVHRTVWSWSSLCRFQWPAHMLACLPGRVSIHSLTLCAVTDLHPEGDQHPIDVCFNRLLLYRFLNKGLECLWTNQRHSVSIPWPEVRWLLDQA